MRIVSNAALIAGVLAACASMSAQQRSADLPSLQTTPGSGELTTRSWFSTPQQANPFGNLFGQRPKTGRKSPSLLTTPLPDRRTDNRVPQQTTVVCGMTLIPADPNLDPAIRRAIPENGPDFTIRAIVPRICQR